jgi:hypothetical protein
MNSSCEELGGLARITLEITDAASAPRTTHHGTPRHRKNKQDNAWEAHDPAMADAFGDPTPRPKIEGRALGAESE